MFLALKTVCLLHKALLAQKLYACCKKRYLLKNCMLVAKSITVSKTIWFMQKALLAQKLYAFACSNTVVSLKMVRQTLKHVVGNW